MPRRLLYWPALEYIKCPAIRAADFSGFFDLEKDPGVPVPAAHAGHGAVEGEVFGFHLGIALVTALDGLGHGVSQRDAAIPDGHRGARLRCRSSGFAAFR